MRTKEYLKNGQASYFRYAAHSIRNIAPKITSSLASKSYSREDIVINLDVYTKAAGDLKDPNNLTVYRINTYLGYQPSPLQLRHPNINPVQVSYADFHALMENKGHILYQSGAFLVYKKEKGHSIDIGDLKAARSTWKKMQPKTSPCNKLSTLADDFPKKVYDMINGLRSRSENGGNAIIHYKPWSEIIDTYAGQGTFQSYTECGNATVVQPILTKNPNNPDNPLLHHVSMHYQNAALLDNVFKGFYNAIYKE
ncbi:hypothetical protein [Wocania ichthyoenteri]|uniref:hypothetical protein n=1 Tax=Wocania ichthyoenteri TaxID=1230531 RepID=UPI0012E04530|nr:hypothetical protein [Wocania ichthyoenteri]